MTGSERLRAALTKRAVDELPVVLKGMEPCAVSRKHRDSSWDPVFERYSETGDILHMMQPATIAKQRNVIRTSRSLRRCVEYQDWETDFETPAGRLREVRRDLGLSEAVVEYAVKSPEDLAAARWVLSEPVVVDAAATVQRFEEIARDPNTLPMLFVVEPVDLVVDLMGAQRFALCLADLPHEFAELVHTAAGPVMKRLERTLWTGIKPVIWVDGAEWVTPPYAGPTRFRELVFPYLRQIVEIAHRFDCPVLSHCHGRVGGVLDQFLESGIDATHPFEAPPAGDTTAMQLKARVARDLCCVGNIQLDDMLRAPQQEIERQVAELLAVFADWSDGGFILTVTGTPTCRQAPPHAVGNYLCLLGCKIP